MRQFVLCPIIGMGVFWERGKATGLTFIMQGQGGNLGVRKLSVRLEHRECLIRSVLLPIQLNESLQSRLHPRGHSLAVRIRKVDPRRRISEQLAVEASGAPSNVVSYGSTLFLLRPRRVEVSHFERVRDLAQSEVEVRVLRVCTAAREQQED